VSSKRDHRHGESLALVAVCLVATVEHVQEVRVGREHRVVEHGADLRATLGDGRQCGTDETLGL